jgi:hypothetical protein
MAGFTPVCYNWGRKLRLRLFEMQIYCEFLRHNSGSLSLMVVCLNVHGTRNV